MAKDDYFVIAYKILTYLYSCIKAGEEVNTDYLQAGTKEFPVAEEYWNWIIGELYEHGYVKNVYAVPVIGKKTPEYRYSDMVITSEGIAYLQENSLFEKVKKAVKEGISMIPKI